VNPEATERCTKLLAQNAAMKLKFHLSQKAIAQSTAEIAIKNVEEVVVDTR